MNLNLIKLDTLATDIFSTVAEAAAEYIYPPQETDKFGKPKYDKKGEPILEKVNHSTQLRKFYDELVMWHDKVFRAANRNEAYQQAAPFIQMMKAKAAYAKGRDHVNDKFVALFDTIIGQIQSPDTLKHAKLFFEAVLGYRRAAEQK